jgi:hypothetical protein
MLMSALKGVFMVVVLVGLLAMDQVGWVVGIGSRGLFERDSRNDRLETQVASHGPFGQWSVFDVDFRTQPDPRDTDLGIENRFWTDDRAFNMAQNGPAWGTKDNLKTKAFTTTWIKWGSNAGEGIAYCSVAFHPRTASFYDATPGPGLPGETMPSTARAPACSVTTRSPP